MCPWHKNQEGRGSKLWILTCQTSKTPTRVHSLNCETCVFDESCERWFLHLLQFFDSFAEWWECWLNTSCYIMNILTLEGQGYRTWGEIRVVKYISIFKIYSTVFHILFHSVLDILDVVCLINVSNLHGLYGSSSSELLQDLDGFVHSQSHWELEQQTSSDWGIQDMTNIRDFPEKWGATHREITLKLLMDFLLSPERPRPP